ncbi:FAD-dependent oxidoreductase [Gordonia sp. SID5947]|uniref:NAD(P)/FAD-dependent oxidoreductase n=1 Tax=Gordonia sp. SID5947 TaxID=2690315 RepID=UPI00136E04E1|nr:FAD-dependent oxidoreductase [Gordonia sp. SID5947]MYR07287.1 FAD-dependent oxidoreductase [Gordonia sp. SID5947]
MSVTSDVAVIGAGIIGLSTAYHLARQGLSVTVYESGPPGRGQSAGQSRIFRHAHDDPRLIDLAIRAREQWRGWSEEFGAQLVSDDGSLALGDAAPRRAALLRQAGIPAEDLDSATVREILPALADYDGHAMFDPGGGSIHTRAAIEALSSRFAARVVNEQVISLHHRGDRVTVHAPTTLGEHGAVAVCAGRGTAALARGVGLALPVRLGAHVRVSFATRERVDRLPTLQDGSGVFGATGVYAAAYPDRSGFGLGLSDSVDAHDDGAIDDGPRLTQLASAAAEYVERALPGLDPTPRDVVHCWVTTLPWGDDGVGIWQADGVFAVAGHNLFKHAPVIGEAVATAVRDGRVPAGFAAGERLGAAQ